MKAQIIADDKTIEVELTKEQAEDIGLVEKQSTSNWGKIRKGTSYYWIGDDGGVNKEFVHDVSDLWDDNKYYIANCFGNIESAERWANILVLLSRIQRWADEHNQVKIDWNNLEQSKFSILYNMSKDAFDVEHSLYELSPFQVYFLSEELALEAIDIFKDDIRKIYRYD